jgi:hypothetical protein
MPSILSKKKRTYSICRRLSKKSTLVREFATIIRRSLRSRLRESEEKNTGEAGWPRLTTENDGGRRTIGR